MVWILVYLALISTAEGRPSLYPRHEATVVSVYDGDTMTVDVVLWPGLTWRGKVRVRGVDTPEIQTKSQSEKRRALLARDFVRERIGKTVYLENVKQGNFSGRVVATVRLQDGSNLAKVLIREGHGKAYKRRR
ncbi:MAG: thermonuclease family protein [Candidatus Latescibacteria bacterium]|nr:thermonuclease family protein [Candidatus Latescibacterota bacterium]